jgi:hypothetical protein
VARFIGCPVCGATLQYRRWPYLEGSGCTPLMVDCVHRHHATTEPHVWEALRVARLCAEIESELRRMDDD